MRRVSRKNCINRLFVTIFYHNYVSINEKRKEEEGWTPVCVHFHLKICKKFVIPRTVYVELLKMRTFISIVYGILISQS